MSGKANNTSHSTAAPSKITAPIADSVRFPVDGKVNLTGVSVRCVSILSLHLGGVIPAETPSPLVSSSGIASEGLLTRHIKVHAIFFHSFWEQSRMWKVVDLTSHVALL